MTDTDRELSLQDEDRLPWLEAVETDDEDEGVNGSKLVLLVLAGLLGLAVLIGGIWWLGNQQQGPSGDGTLIAAQEGDYKVKPDEPGGMKVEGQGDASFAASEGAEANGKVDMAANPEAPVTVVKQTQTAAKPATPAAKPAVTATLAAPSAMPLSAPAPSGGGLVQLGAYGSQASADEAWTMLSGKNPALARLSKSIVPAAVGGKTLYRLRANAGSPAAAAALCAKVGNCIVVK
ncbi:MAG: SPOR domain-containing protein [Pseudomonadota bacterium]